MACSSYYVTADAVSEFLCRSEGYGPADVPTLDDVENYIRKVAARINMTLAATGQCDCTLNAYATELLQELNLIGAAILVHCPDCGRRFTDEQRDFWNTWLGDQLALLRSGELELCDGETAPQYPHMTWAEQSVTDWNAARIIYNDELRNA